MSLKQRGKYQLRSCMTEQDAVYLKKKDLKVKNIKGENHLMKFPSLLTFIISLLFDISMKYQCKWQAYWNLGKTLPSHIRGDMFACAVRSHVSGSERVSRCLFNCCSRQQ